MPLVPIFNLFKYTKATIWKSINIFVLHEDPTVFCNINLSGTAFANMASESILPHLLNSWFILIIVLKPSFLL